MSFSVTDNINKEFVFRVIKGGVIKVDIREICDSFPKEIHGQKHGTISISKPFIYYSPDKDFVGKDEVFILENVKENTSVKLTFDVVSTFKPKAHILVLLGEELIKSPVMAIYELIKNSYDADAQSVNVTFNNIEDTHSAEINISDDGTGITKEVLENVWFEPGSDFRKPVNVEGVRQVKRSPIYWRIPMGEKGVGRFAVHKLGHTIKLISRPAKIEVDNYGKSKSVTILNYEVEVNIDWRTFSQSKYLEDVKIEWYVRTDETDFFHKDGHGTNIIIGNLKETWTRGMARQLKRNTISMLSPKNDSNRFQIKLDFGNWWLNNFPEIDEILNQAPYKLVAYVSEDFQMTFEYTFKLNSNDIVRSRSISSESTDKLLKAKYETNIKGSLKPFYRSYLEDHEYNSNEIEVLMQSFDSNSNILPYGPVMMEIYSYDLDSTSLRDYTSTPNIVKSTLKEHAGIKVFKGNLRVYDYGDPGNDWLGLDIKRVNNKSWFSNNQVIGYIYLDDERSGSLVEKTNREGFIKNASYDHFLVLLEFLLNEFKNERLSDRSRWLANNRKGPENSFEEQLNSFKGLINDTNYSEEEKKQKLLGEANKIEERYKNDKETLLIPAGVGMTASFAIHEIEKLVPRLQESVKEEPLNKSKLSGQVLELKDYSDGILSILRRGGNKEIVINDAVNQAINNFASRLKYRQIEVNVDFDEKAHSVICDRRLLITMLMNLFDNSIYWLDTMYSEQKRIFIATRVFNENISIIVADNGPGFKDKVEDIVRPFFSRKQGGIGIGLYMIDTVMAQYGKLNIIFDSDYKIELDIPEVYSGAAVELKFKSK